MAYIPLTTADDRVTDLPQSIQTNGIGSAYGYTSGLVSRQGDNDYWRFTFTPGTYYLIQGQTEDWSLDWYFKYSVVSSTGVVLRDWMTPVAGAVQYRNQSFTIETAGEYFISAWSWCPYATGAYAFRIAEHYVDPRATPSPLNISTLYAAGGAIVNPTVQVEGMLETGTDSERIQLRGLIAGHKYRIYLSGDAERNDPLKNPVLEIFEGSTSIATRINSYANGPEFTAAIAGKLDSQAKIISSKMGSSDAYYEFTAKSGVEYYTSIKSAVIANLFGIGQIGGTGDFELRLTDVTNLTDDGGQTIAQSRSIDKETRTATGSIEVGADKDWFNVFLDAGVTYELRISGAGDQPLLDPYLRLYGSSNEFIAYNNNYIASEGGAPRKQDALLLFTPSASGIYYLEASDWGNGIGSYQVSAIARDFAQSNSTTIQKLIPNAAAVSGAIDYRGDSDWYRVILSKGTNYDFFAEGSGQYSLNSPLISLRNSQGQLISSQSSQGSQSASLRYSATESGVYYIDIQAVGSEIGSFRVGVLTSDDYTASTLTLGLIDGFGGATGRIDYAGDQDWIKFDVSRVGTYVLQATGVDGGAGMTLADPRILGIYNDSGQLIYHTGNDDYGQSRDALVRFMASKTGAYFLAVGSGTSNDTGSYQVSISEEVRVDIAGDRSTRNVITSGKPVSGLIETSGDKDWFSIDLQPGTYVIDLVADTTQTYALKDAVFGGIYSSNGVLLENTSNDNYGASLNSRMIYTVSNAGTYFLEATAKAGYTGAYQLSIKPLPSSGNDTGSSIASHGALGISDGKGVLTGEIDIARDVDWYAVSLEKGQQYEIMVRGSASGMGTLLNPRLVGIYDANGHLIIGSAAEDGEGSNDVRTGFSSVTAGTYYLAVGGAADDTGTYKLSIRSTAPTDDIPADETTAAIASASQGFKGTIDFAEDSDWIKVDLEAGTAQFKLYGYESSLGVLTAPRISNLYDADGKVMRLMVDPAVNWVSPTAGFSTIAQTDYASMAAFLPAAGTYYVEVAGYAGAIGGYQLVTKQTPADEKLPTLTSSYVDGNSSVTTQFSTNQPIDEKITLEFNRGFYNQQIQKGQGKIYIEGAGPTIIIDVNSEQVQISGNFVSIDPGFNLKPNTDYRIDIDPGAFKDTAGYAFAGAGLKKEFGYDPNELVFRTASSSSASARDDWTIMVYMAADSDLESQALLNLQEMLSVSLPSDVNVVVMIDRAQGYDAADENWSGSYWGSLDSINSVSNIPTQWTSLGEVNTGSATTLTNFINIAKQNYQADKYGLIMWGAGGGITGYGWDNSASMDSLSLKELSTALTGAGLSASNRLDVLAFDASLMGLQETLWEVKDFTKYFVASENIVTGEGFAYANILNSLASNSRMNGKQLSSTIVSTYFKENGNEGVSLAAYETSNAAAVNDVAARLDGFAQAALRSTDAREWAVIHDGLTYAASSPTTSAQQDHYRDLYTFLRYVEAHTTSGTNNLNANAASAANAIQYFIVGTNSEFQTAFASGAGSGGVGIYLPDATMIPDALYTSQNFRFLSNSGSSNGFASGIGVASSWDEFLNKIQADLTNKAPTNLQIHSHLTSIDEIVTDFNQSRLTKNIKVATLSYGDDNWTAGNTYTLTGTDGNRFTIVGNDLYLKRGTPLQYYDTENPDHQYSVTVSLTDPTLPTNEQIGINSIVTYSLNINNVDEYVPTFTSATSGFSVNENVATNTVIYTAQAIDGPQGDADPGTLTYALKANGDFGLLNINATTGAVSLNSSPDFETKNFYEFTVIAKDSVGKLAEQTVEVNVNDVADSGSDLSGPIVRKFTPSDDSFNVALNSNIVVKFNESIQLGSGSIMLKTLSGQVVETFPSDRLTVDNAAKTLTINPTAQLLNNKTYVVEFEAGSVKDLAGNSNSAISNYNFKTIAGIDGVDVSVGDSTSPTVIGSVPLDNAASVAIDSNIVINFNEAIQRGSGSATLYKLGANNTTTVVENFDLWSSDRLTINNIFPNGDAAASYSLTLDPTSLLERNSHYKLVFSDGAVVDAAGNSYQDAGTYDFTTTAKGSFDIEVVYSNSVLNVARTSATIDGVLNEELYQSKLISFKAAVQAAVDEWETIIVGDLPTILGNKPDGSADIDDFRLLVSMDPTISPLGLGGTTGVRPADQGGTPFSGEIIMRGLSSDTRAIETLVHEVGHALGFSSMWCGLGVRNQPDQYIGQNALDVYRQMMGNWELEYIPLETEGGTGTRYLHWSESMFKNEVMTGWINFDANPTSLLTVAAMADIGYEVDFSMAEQYSIPSTSSSAFVDASGSTGSSIMGGAMPEILVDYEPSVLDYFSYRSNVVAQENHLVVLA